MIAWLRRLFARRHGRALGFVNVYVSGAHRPWDEQQIRSAGPRLGYSVLKTMTVAGRGADPISALVALVRATSVDAVLVPTIAHLDQLECDAVNQLLPWADIIPLDDPAQTIQRRLAWPVKIELEGR